MSTAILYPVIAHILLTFVLLLCIGVARQKALEAKEATLAEIALDESRWPGMARKFGNCYKNQFELPVIFYALCLIAYQTFNVDLLMVILAWGFIASRIVHAYIHTTSNIVPLRGAVFAIGFLIIALMTVLLLLRLLLEAS